MQTKTTYATGTKLAYATATACYEANERFEVIGYRSGQLVVRPIKSANGSMYIDPRSEISMPAYRLMVVC